MVPSTLLLHILNIQLHDMAPCGYCTTSVTPTSPAVAGKGQEQRRLVTCKSLLPRSVFPSMTLVDI